MKIYYIQWRNCIKHQNFVLINARSEKERDEKFNKWCEQNPEVAPCCFSPREISFENCLHLNNI